MNIPILNTLYEIFEERERFRKLKLFTIISAIIIGYGFLVYTLLTMPDVERTHVSVQPAVPSSNGSSQVTNNMPVFKTMHSVSPFRHHIQTPQVSMPSISSSRESSTLTIYTTSSSKPTFVGGGFESSALGNSANHKTARSDYSTTMPSLTYAINMQTTSSFMESTQQRLKKHNLNAESTIASIQNVIDNNGPNSSPARAKKENWDDYEQDDEPFLDPIGDVAWGLMALLTIGYGVIVRRRRQQACK